MLNFKLDGKCYIDVESYKSGDNPTFTDVVVIDRKKLLENTEESLQKIREWDNNG